MNTQVIGSSNFFVGGNHDEHIVGDLNSDIKKDKNWIYIKDVDFVFLYKSYKNNIK